MLEEAPIPPPRPQQSITTTAPDIPVAYNDKVVAFLRQPNIMDILKERHPGFGQNVGLREKVNAIRIEGSAALQRLGHDVPLALLLRYEKMKIIYDSKMLIQQRIVENSINFSVYLNKKLCRTYPETS